MRTVGLALVDEGRGVVDVLRIAIGIGAGDGGAGDGYLGVAGIGRAVGARRAIQRVGGFQHDRDLAVATGAELVEAVVEELAEDGEPGIDRRDARVLRADEELSRCRVLKVDMAERFEQAVAGTVRN